MERLLILNMGSTSTKLSIYDGETEVCAENIIHDAEELMNCETVNDELPMRLTAVRAAVGRAGAAGRQFDAIVSRGGSTFPLNHWGAYEINADMADDLMNHPASQHAGNLGPIIAYTLAQEWNIHAYIYDSVAVDELSDVAAISGLAEIRRASLVHGLNSRYVAREVSKELGKPYESLNFIVAHIGGGITITLHQGGKLSDVVGDDEGPFSPERSGGVPTRQLVDLCYSGKYPTRNRMQKAMRGGGGLMSYLGTNDARQVEHMARNGDEKAALIYDAMLYQVAKGIAQLAVVPCGRVDGIILTGGIAHSQMAVTGIRRRVEFIAPVFVKPGENEMRALCSGGLAVLRGRELPHHYVKGGFC